MIHGFVRIQKEKETQILMLFYLTNFITSNVVISALLKRRPFELQSNHKSEDSEKI